MKILVGFLKVDAIGHIWLNPLNIAPIIYSKKVILFYNLKFVCNKRAINILKATLPKNYFLVPYYNFLDKFFRLFIEMVVFFPLSKLFKKFDTSRIHFDYSMKKYGSKYRFFRYKDRLPINYGKCIVQRQNTLFNIFDKFKIDKKFYVVFFFRDNQYWGKDPLNQIRNSNINSYLPLINLFIKNQIPIIRAGRSEKPREDYFKSRYYFDISWSDQDPESYEDILFANAGMILGSNSGIMLYQKLEHNPMILTNWIPVGLKPYFKNTLYLCKHFYLSEKEIRPCQMPRELWLNEDIRDYEAKDYRVIDNNSDLIIESVNEIIEFGENKIKNNFYENNNGSMNKSILPFVYGGESKLSRSYIKYISNL